MPARVLPVQQDMPTSSAARPKVALGSVKRTVGNASRPSQPIRTLKTKAETNSAVASTSKSKVGSTSSAARQNVEKQKAEIGKKDVKESEDERLILALSSPQKFTCNQVNQFMHILGTSADELTARLFHQTYSEVERHGQDDMHSNLINSKAENIDLIKKVLIAKQVVNGVITTLNNLITSAWKPKSNSALRKSTSNEAFSSSRSSSVISAQKHEGSSVRSSKPIPKANNKSLKDEIPRASVNLHNVAAILDCFRIAILFLLKNIPAEKSKEIEGIVLSVIRKTVALELYEIASYDLEWLRKWRYQDAFDIQTSFPLKKVYLTIEADPVVCATLLDIQSLSYQTSLFLIPKTEITSTLSKAIEHPLGPLNAQIIARTVFKNQLDVKSIDRYAYTIERAIMRLHALHSDPESEEIDAGISFACRSASLRILQTISDLDQDAFWERAARAGISHFRSSVDDESKFAVFEEINNLFKDLTKRSDRYETMSIHTKDLKGTGKGLKTFRDTWQHLARKAGSVCHRLTSEPVRAEKAYLEALQSVDNNVWQEIVKEANSQPISELFKLGHQAKEAPTNNIIDTGRLVRVIFEMQIFELLRFQKEEKTVFDIIEGMQNSASKALPTLLEMCLETLDSTIHRDEGPNAFEKIMKRLLTFYDATTMPLRRSRILLRQLERHVLFPTDEDAFDQAQLLIGNIQDLLSNSNMGLDEGLIKYKSQYQAMLSIFQAKLEMQQSNGTSRMIDYLRDVVKHTSTLLPSSDPKQAAGNSHPPERRILRNASAPRQVKSREPKTPPSNAKIEQEKRYKSISKVESINKVSSNVKTEQRDHFKLDNGEKFLRLLEWSVESEVWHGSGSVSIEIAKCGRKIALSLAGDASSDCFVHFSSKLIFLFVTLGQYKQAEKIICEMNKDEFPKNEIWANYKLVEAEYLFHVGRFSEAMNTFDEATELLEQSEPREKLSGIQSALQKIHATESQAIAYRIYGQIQLGKGNQRFALQSAIDSVKHAMKSGSMLSRLCSRSDGEGQNNSPFVVQPPQEGIARNSKSVSSGGKIQAKPRFSSVVLAILHWRIVRTLHESYLLVSRIHSIRGSAKDSEAFATECIEFDSNAHTPALHGLAILQRASLRIRMGQEQGATDDLLNAVNLIDPQHETYALAILTFLQGDQHFRSESYADASKQFTVVEGILFRIDTMHVNAEETQESVLSVLKALLIRKQAWLLHVMGEEEECKRILDGIDDATHQHDSGELDLLRGKIAIQQALSYLKRDPQLDLVSEATISIPSVLKNIVGEKSIRDVRLSPRSSEAGQASLEILLHAQTLFDRVIALPNNTASTVIQEAFAQRTICNTLLSILPSFKKHTPEKSNEIDEIVAVTLERELDEILENKLNGSSEFGSSRTMNQKWPRFNSSTFTEVAKDIPRKGIKKELLSAPMKKSRAISTDEDSSEGEQQDAPHKAYWKSVKGNRSESKPTNHLPAHWTVVSVSLAKDRNCLSITRRNGGLNGRQTLYSIPIDRQSRREGEEEEDSNTSVHAILSEIREIVEKSNLATHSAQNLQSLDARKAWWTERRMLDKRLKEVLELIQTIWLGAFRSLFLEAPFGSKESKAAFRESLQEIFMRCCCSRTIPSKKVNKQEMNLAKVQLEDEIVEQFCSLNGSEYSDEDLEDLTHFVMDGYQSKGIPIAVDEVDMDVCVTDIRAAIDTYRNRISQEENEKANQIKDDHHLFLILDKELCSIPWESLPCLRGKAICRIPSMDFLNDRLHWSPSGQFVINSEKTRLSYVLNPSQELIRTQERFQPFLQSNLTPSTSSMNSVVVTPARSQRPSLLDAMENTLPSTPKWKGIVGRAPIMDEFARALESNDIMLYFGHGGAEQYIRVSRLRSLMRCAVTMLWGCSSGILREMGEFERYGTPNNYMLAGCPALVGNLWDATDKELDGISESVMKKFGLMEKEKGGGISLAKAVAESRDACKLPFLTGAACVVYGIPVYYR